MTYNFHNMFTYESIEYGDGEKKNLSYKDCTILRDMGDFKKGMKVAFIALGYKLYGWSKHDGSDRTEHDLFSGYVVDLTDAGSD